MSMQFPPASGDIPAVRADVGEAPGGSTGVVARVAAPTLIILLCTFSCIIGMLFWLTGEQNRMQADREASLLRLAVEQEVGALRQSVRDYGLWDDAVSNLAWRLDPDWADANIGPYLFRLRGYRHSFVLDGSGRTIYASSGTARASLDARALLGPAFHQAMARIHARRVSDDRGEAGLAVVGGQPWMFAVGPIHPNPGRVAPPPGRPHLIAFATPLGRAEIARFARYADVETLTFSAGRRDERLSSIELRTPAGVRIGVMEWKAHEPGTHLRRRAGLLLALALAALVVLAVWMTTGLRRAVEELRQSRRISHDLAYNDPLTGLPNRRAFLDDIQALPTTEHVAVLFVDLDGFKEVNDSLGHGAGDELLKQAARRLRQACGPDPLLARLGGDEFAVRVMAPDAGGGACAVAARIVQAASVPFDVAGGIVGVGASVGVAIGLPAVDGDELLRRADVAMYAAKAEGKGRWLCHTADMDAGRSLRARIQNELRRDLERGLLRVEFDPVVDAGTRAMVCVEALARWTSPVLGVVTPDLFIPVAEESGLIRRLGRIVLEQACGHQMRSGSALDLAVNVSPVQFRSTDFVEEVLEVLDRTGFPPSRLVLEITEGLLMQQTEAIDLTLSRLREVGIRLSLDDFGTGYASIGYLRRLKLDQIKLDRSLIAGIAGSDEAAALASAVIALARTLRISVVAEGIETEEQALLLERMGCDTLQGWLFSRPRIADAGARVMKAAGR